MELRYQQSWVESPEGRPLSLSLPFGLPGVSLRGNNVGWFFDNLLPDRADVRHRLQQRYSARSQKPFDLLAEIGADCVGAVQLLPAGKEPPPVDRIEGTPLDDAGVERELLASRRSTGAYEDDVDFRISLAGAQQKTALLMHEGRLCAPRGATPTTHILKLAIGDLQGKDLSGSVENEWLCLQLLGAYGLPVARADIRDFGATRALVVERFDRKLHSSGRYWLRLPQEDFCQATGTPSEKKYEQEGGPGLKAIANILRSSEHRDEDLGTLLRAQVLFWMLAAIDGHAKNWSLHILPGGRYQLTPMYDVVSAWPVVGPGANQIHPKKLKLAMAIWDKNRHYRREEIQRSHFERTARECGLGIPMGPIIDDLVARTDGAISRVESELPKGFPTETFDSITSGLRASARALRSG
jgi:serine/threonine-protein kinase HipA